MATYLNPYLSFRDTAREALTFYQSVFGGELNIMTFGEMHASDDPAEADKVMHGQLDTPNGLVLQGSDTPNSMEINPGDSVAVSVHGDDHAELGGYWKKLSEGAVIAVPFELAPWGDTFGILVDRFGVNWYINAAGAAAS